MGPVASTPLFSAPTPAPVIEKTYAKSSFFSETLKKAAVATAAAAGALAATYLGYSLFPAPPPPTLLEQTIAGVRGAAASVTSLVQAPLLTLNKFASGLFKSSGTRDVGMVGVAVLVAYLWNDDWQRRLDRLREDRERIQFFPQYVVRDARGAVFNPRRVEIRAEEEEGVPAGPAPPGGARVPIQVEGGESGSDDDDG